MEIPVLTHFQRNILGFVGLLTIVFSMIQPYFWVNPDSIAAIPEQATIIAYAGAFVGMAFFFLAAFLSKSEIPYEPPFWTWWKIRWHRTSIENNEIGIRNNSKLIAKRSKWIADWKLEIEKRLSRIAELERDKQ